MTNAKPEQTNKKTNLPQSLPTQADVFPTNSVDWLKRLIGFATVSHESNLALIEDVQRFTHSLGLEPVLTFNAERTKANLFVTVPAGQSQTVQSQSQMTGGIVLSGHTDVVPVAGQAWTSDPFCAEVRDDKLYGRGACDMKGFIACSLTILPKAVALSQAGQLSRPVHVALSFDEEVGCLGAPIMLADLQKRGISPEYCIVGEPSMMRMVTAHKGISVFRCRVHGKSAHSSLTPQGVNAISYASKLIGFIDELAGEFAQTNEQTGDDRSSYDALFDVPYATLSVGTIQGGTATNIVPNLCEFTFDYRNLPSMTTDAILTPIHAKIEALSEQMQAVDEYTSIEIEQLEDVPAMTDSDSEALQELVAGLTDDDTRTKVAYATEGGQFTNAGIPTVICGPGSIDQAHKADEFVSLDQLAQCDEFLAKLIASL